jgi:hypothetical protein
MNGSQEDHQPHEHDHDHSAPGLDRNLILSIILNSVIV